MGDIVNCDQGLSLKRNVQKAKCFEQILTKYQGNTQGCWIPRFGCTHIHHHQQQQQIHHHHHHQQQHDDDEDDVVDEAQYKSGV